MFRHLSCLVVLLAAPAAAGVPRVVADLPPVHSLVAQVMGDLGEPVLLLERGADPHHFQLRPSQARRLHEADLVIWAGPGMSPWLARALGDRPALRLEGGTEEGHHHEAAGHHDEGQILHPWLEPETARLWLGAIGAELARLDPDHAADYRARAEAAQARLAALDADLDRRLEPARDRPFLVFHDAYAPFADHYGLTVAGSVTTSDAAPPGAAHLAELRQTARPGTCLFPEALHDAGLARQIAADTGARLGPPLDPEGSTLEPGPALYEALMRGLAESILSCVADG